MPLIGECYDESNFRFGMDQGGDRQVSGARIDRENDLFPESAVNWWNKVTCGEIHTSSVQRRWSIQHCYLKAMFIEKPNKEGWT